jgi:hypothetical protein
MALLIKHGSTAPEVLEPSVGKCFDLISLQRAVGGYIEIIRMADHRYMVVNEDGRLQHLPINVLATKILSDIGVAAFGDVIKGEDVVKSFGYIVGDVLICEEDEV